MGAYCRVSTEDQSREGYSIPAQKERLLAFCRAQGWDVADIYCDEGISGAKMERPELARLRTDVAAKKVNMVLAWKIDRLSRKVSHLAALVDEFDRAGCAIRSVTEPFDTSHAAGRAFMQMLSVFAELERETIRERSKMGIRQRVKEGYTHGRPTPFGYRRQGKGVWEVHEEEAEIVRYIFRRYREGAGAMKIAQELAASSWPVPATETDGPHYDRLTSLMDRVRWMLDNPVYAGFAPLGDELFTGRHPAIISPDDWQAARALRKGERAVPNRAKRSVYPLSGLAKCGECGRSMFGFRQPSKAKDPKALAARPYYSYYVCTGSSQLRGKSRACDNWGMLTERVEAAVIDSLKRLYLDATLIEEQVPVGEAEEDRGQMPTLKRKLALVRRRREKWFRAFEDDDTMASIARERLRELAEEESQITRAIAEEEAKQAPRERMDRRAALDMLKNIGPVLSLAGPDERRQIYRLFVREVRVFRDKHIEVDLYPL